MDRPVDDSLDRIQEDVEREERMAKKAELEEDIRKLQEQAQRYYDAAEDLGKQILYKAGPGYVTNYQETRDIAITGEFLLDLAREHVSAARHVQQLLREGQYDEETQEGDVTRGNAPEDAPEHGQG